jgi:hypothetical protein
MDVKIPDALRAAARAGTGSGEPTIVVWLSWLGRNLRIALRPPDWSGLTPAPATRSGPRSSERGDSSIEERPPMQAWDLIRQLGAYTVSLRLIPQRDHMTIRAQVKIEGPAVDLVRVDLLREGFEPQGYRSDLRGEFSLGDVPFANHRLRLTNERTGEELGSIDLIANDHPF